MSLIVERVLAGRLGPWVRRHAELDRAPKGFLVDFGDARKSLNSLKEGRLDLSG